MTSLFCAMTSTHIPPKQPKEWWRWWIVALIDRQPLQIVFANFILFIKSYSNFKQNGNRYKSIIRPSQKFPCLWYLVSWVQGRKTVGMLSLENKALHNLMPSLLQGCPSIVNLLPATALCSCRVLVRVMLVLCSVQLTGLPAVQVTTELGSGTTLIEGRFPLWLLWRGILSRTIGTEALHWFVSTEGPTWVCQ